MGGGWNAEEIEDHGTAFKTCFKLMRERIEAMKEIWTQTQPEYHGELVIVEAERRFPCRIKLGVPTGGFGERLT